MRKLIFLSSCSLVILVLGVLASTAQAQSANDVGTNPAPIPLVPGGVGQGGIPGCETCPPVGVQSSSFSGNNSQMGRLFRDAIAGTCANKAYPGTFNAATTYYYEAFVYHNFGPAACITVNWDPGAGGNPCTTNGHAKVYSPSYDPINQNLNFLSDVGSSLTQPFMATVPADADFVLVAENTAVAATCTFAYEILNTPCQTDPSLCQIPVELERFSAE
jgi:hypothetical protein